jgi:hypothetical protein
MQNQFFSNDSFVSLGSASAIVLVVSNTLQGSLNFNPRWLALVLAELVAVYGTYLDHSTASPSDYFIALLNGCLIYCTAVGGATLAALRHPRGKPKGVSPTAAGEKRQFTTSWF